MSMMVASMNKPLFIIDSSYLLTYLFPDENNTLVDITMKDHREHSIQLLSTTLLPFEVMNGLRSGFLRHRLRQSDVHKAQKVFQLLTIDLVEPDGATILEIALKHSISCYDAAYIALAREKNAKLLTFDKNLQKIHTTTEQ